MLSCIFLIGYGIARLIGEVFRQPDPHLGFLFGGVTMGQLLSLPMVAAGAWLVLRARRRPAAA
jgi:phosphatidylglycerol:prolipoprotein diacylglycerol transferase